MIKYFRKLDFPLYMLRRNIFTLTHKCLFKSFGKGSKLAQGTRLMRVGYATIGNDSSIMSNCVIECCPCRLATRVDNRRQCINWRILPHHMCR